MGGITPATKKPFSLVFFFFTMSGIKLGGAPSDKCMGCGKTVYPAEKISMRDTIWHIECLRCDEEVCNKKLNGGNWGGFIPNSGDNMKPYCKHHHDRIALNSAGRQSPAETWRRKKAAEAAARAEAGEDVEETSSSPSTSRFGGNYELCEACGKKCYMAEKVVMEGQTWHANCLRCAEDDCNKKLSGANWGGFVPPDNKPYCKSHHSKLVRAAGSSVGISGSTTEWTPKESTGEKKPSRFGGNYETCTRCSKKCYMAEKVTMEGQVWHANCLRCDDCNKKLSGANWGGFVPPDNVPYCKPCYKKMVMAAGSSVAISGSTAGWTPKESTGEKKPSRFGGNYESCTGCGKKCYMAEKVSMEGQVWHENCLRCKECNKKISGANWGAFVPPDDKPHCKPCYTKLVMAAGNSVALSGSSARKTASPTASPKTTRKFNFGGNYESCAVCSKKVYMAEKITMEGGVYHINCLRCKECNQKVTGANYGGFVPPDNDLLCSNHYNQMISKLGSAVGISGSTTDSKWEISNS